MKKQKIVTIGGGAGSFMVLSGLKKYPVDLSAIVSMADDGGSSGALRRELGVLPPGDARQCLIALAEGDRILKELFAYRYDNGGLKGHVFGNLFLATLEKAAGGFDAAIKLTENILKIKGRVLPVTLDSVNLIAELKNGGKIAGESKIYGYADGLIDLKKLYLKPAAALNPEAEKAIKRADKIVICPGDLCSSLIASFLVKGLGRAIARTKAKVIYVSNLITKPGQTDGFVLADYVEILEKYLGRGAIDYVVYNKEKPAKKFLKKRLRPGENLTAAGDLSRWPKIRFLGYNLLSRRTVKVKSSDRLSHLRAAIKHDSYKLAKVIYNI